MLLGKNQRPFTVLSKNRSTKYRRMRRENRRSRRKTSLRWKDVEEHTAVCQCSLLIQMWSVLNPLGEEIKIQDVLILVFFLQNRSTAIDIVPIELLIGNHKISKNWGSQSEGKETWKCMEQIQLQEHIMKGFLHLHATCILKFSFSWYEAQWGLSVEVSSVSFSRILLQVPFQLFRKEKTPKKHS